MRSNLRIASVCTSVHARLPAWFAGALLLASGGLWASQTGPEQSTFWRITKDGADAGYVLGTMHSEDPRVLDFPVAFLAQLTSCPVFAMELVPDAETLSQINELMRYRDADTLARILGPERYDRTMQALVAYHVPPDMKARMKAWAVMMTLSVPVPETGFFMDFSLSIRAAGAGASVKGLETLEQQVSFLENMPIAYQLALLDQALSEYQQVEELNQRMLDIYLSGDLAGLQRISDEQFAQLDPEVRDYFLRGGISERNEHMVTKLLTMLQEDRVFVAVGALHLPGPDGLLALLSRQGYTLEPLPMPFSPAAGADMDKAKAKTETETETETEAGVSQANG